MTENDAVALKAVNLSRDFDGIHALIDVDLRVSHGELVALVGLNGAGKSTLMSIAAGLLEPSKGRVLVEGNPAGSLEARTALAYAPDNPVLYDDLSVWEQLEFTAGLHSTDDWEPLAQWLLQTFRLTERANDVPTRFSRGMRQKSGLAVALIRPASVLIVDEPFVGLDVHAQDELVEVLRQRAADGAAVVVATHQPAFLESVERCVMLREGRVQRDGPVSDDVLNALRRGS